MELIYLWVEDYKNIKRQGFNFSGRHRCEYDREKNELTLEERGKEYVNIFPPNINITAVVGENGSGKSSIAKIILMLSFYIKNKELKFPPLEAIDGNIADKFNAKELIKQYKNSFFLVIKECNIYKKITIDDGFSEVKLEKVDCISFFSIHFNYMLDTLSDNGFDAWINTVYHRNDRYEMPILLEPYKNANNEEKIDLKIIEYLNNQRILKFYNKIKNDKLINNFFNPDKLKILHPSISDLGLKRIPKENAPTQYTYLTIIQNMTKLSHKIQKLYSSRITRERIGIILDKIQILYDEKKIIEQNKIYLALKLVDRNLLDNHQYSKQIDKIFIDTKNIKAKDVVNRVIKEIDKIGLENILPANDRSFENEKLRRCIDFHRDFQNANFQERFNKALDDINYIKELGEDFYRLVPPWLEAEFYDGDKSIKSLSSGEKGLFTFIINILYQLSNLTQKQEYQSINLFLDETDVGFHPEWQKKYFNEIVISIQKIWEKKINIVFFTHSPFILSDIPKENVVFLEKYEEKDLEVQTGKQKVGNCKNVTKKTNIETFGANIHTLLSHGFFMEDGLMGEFAKSKIDEVIKLLKSKRCLSQGSLKKCKDIISIIGEPVLQRTLQTMLDEKKSSHLTKLEKLKLQQKQIEERIKELEGHTNETN